MKIIDKIIWSYEQPRLTNVLWFDATNNTLKIYNAGAWLNTTGSSKGGPTIDEMHETAISLGVQKSSLIDLDAPLLSMEDDTPSARNSFTKYIISKVLAGKKNEVLNRGYITTSDPHSIYVPLQADISIIELVDNSVGILAISGYVLSPTDIGYVITLHFAIGAEVSFDESKDFETALIADSIWTTTDSTTPKVGIRCGDGRNMFTLLDAISTNSVYQPIIDSFEQGVSSSILNKFYNDGGIDIRINPVSETACEISVETKYFDITTSIAVETDAEDPQSMRVVVGVFSNNSEHEGFVEYYNSLVTKFKDSDDVTVPSISDLSDTFATVFGNTLASIFEEFDTESLLAIIEA